MRVLGVSLLLLGLAGSAFAGVPAVPEIDGSTVVASIALVAGGLVVLRARKRQ